MHRDIPPNNDQRHPPTIANDDMRKISQVPLDSAVTVRDIQQQIFDLESTGLYDNDDAVLKELYTALNEAYHEQHAAEEYK